MLQDLSRLYVGEALPPVKLHFADLVWWDQESTSSTTVQKSTQKVIKRLDGAERLHMPEDGARASNGQRIGMTLPVQLGPDVVAAVERQATAAGASHFMVIGAAYSAALASFSHQSDFILGTSVLAREHAGAERVPGIFVEMLPLRCRLDGNLGFEQWIQAFRDAALDAFDDLHASYQEVVRALGFSGTSPGDPLVSVALSMFAEQEGISGLFPGLTFQQVAEQRGARFDMEMSIRTSGGSYTGTLFGPFCPILRCCYVKASPSRNGLSVNSTAAGQRLFPSSMRAQPTPPDWRPGSARWRANGERPPPWSAGKPG